jgi:hypothetical protein
VPLELPEPELEPELEADPELLPLTPESGADEDAALVQAGARAERRGRRPTAERESREAGARIAPSLTQALHEASEFEANVWGYRARR